MADKYRAARTGDFVQARPELENTFLEDHALQSMLRRLLPETVSGSAESALRHLGSRCAGELAAAALQCEQQPPELECYDGWGARVDNVRTSEAWRGMKRVCAEEGLISTGYKREQGEFSRVLQASKLLLFAPSSGLYSCPLAMTDGAAKVLEGVLRRAALPEAALSELRHAFARLTSDDPALFATSGQWMTERRGGSDVANGTDTYAVAEEPSSQVDSATSHRLFGYKWFTSATDADMAITLARPEGPPHGGGGEGGATAAAAPAAGGNRGLAAYFLWTRVEAGGPEGGPASRLNGLTVEKLKKKLGTRQLPTGELLLDGARATQICEVGQGIPQIMVLANITRLHNAITCAGGMRRMLQLCRDYACRRLVAGRLLIEDALHLHTLAGLEVETRGATALVLEVALLLGRTEVPRDAADAARAASLLRILTPLAKLLTGKMAVHVASEGLEAFGGAGYLEDTGLPAMLRDAQVLPIWEGTTNVNALDVLRSVQRSAGEALRTLCAEAKVKLVQARGSASLRLAAGQVSNALAACEEFAAAHLGSSSSSGAALLARDFATLLGRAYTAALLLEHAAWAGATEGDGVAARRFAQTLEEGGRAAVLQAATAAARPPPPTPPRQPQQQQQPGLAEGPPAAGFALSPAGASSEERLPPTSSLVPALTPIERLRHEDRLLVLEGWHRAPTRSAL